MIEHEVVDLFVGHADDSLFIEPNPDEVMETAWVPLTDLTARVQAEPARYTPWLRIYLAEGRVLETLTGRDPAHV